MQEVLLVVHLILAIVIVILVLLQRSEGGALGMGGGGGGGGGFMTGREAANLLTRMTAVFAGLFMVTSLALTIMARPEKSSSIVDKVQQQVPATNQPLKPKKPSVPVQD